MAEVLAGFRFCGAQSEVSPPGFVCQTTDLGGFVLLEWAGNFWVQFFQMRLQTVAIWFRQTDEFNSHADTRVAGAHHSAGTHLLGVHPEVNFQSSTYRNWQDSLDITSVATHIGGIHSHGSVHALIAQFNRERNS